MDACRALVLRFLLPAAYVALLPLVWTDSGASREWEFFEVPPGFADRLLMPTALLVAVIALQVWLDSRAGSGGERPFPTRWNFWLLAAVFTLFLFRAGQYADVFPIHPLGETNSAILGARLVREHGAFSAYNAGFGVLFRPFFELLGYSFPLMRALTILVWATALVAIIALYSGLHRGANHPLVLVPPVLVAMILPSLRTYTWHAGATLASVAAFFLVAAAAVRGRVAFRLACLLAGSAFYAAGFSAYHAAALYLPLAVVVAAPSFVRRGRTDRTTWATLAVVALLAMASVAAIRSAQAYPLADRFAHELGDARPNWDKPSNLLRSWDNFFYSFLWHDVSVPGSVLFLAGLAGCLASFRTCLFARTSLALFAIVYGAQAFLWGHADWSQNCYTIVPVLGVMMVGLRQLTRSLTLAPPAWAGAAAAAALLAIGLAEYRHYFESGLFADRQYEQHPHDTHIQLSLALRDAATLVEKEDAVVFMPALSGPLQPVSYETRGLDWRHPRSRRMLARARYFTSPDDLAAQVGRAREESRHRVRIYFGCPSDVVLPNVSPYLERLPPGATLVRREAYREILYPHTRLLVTYVDLPPRPNEGRRAGG